MADLEIRHIQVDIYKHGDRTQEQHMNSAPGPGGRKLNQMPMIMAVGVYNHCPCMVDNVVIYAPDGFPTIFPNGTDERICSKVREHLYLINEDGPLEPSVIAGCALHHSPLEASVKHNISGAGPFEPSVKDSICASASFFYTSYEQIKLKPAFLVPHC